MNILIDLFLTFAKIGLFTFGGGYAMIPIFEREFVHDRGWITSEDMLNYVAISQSTPGVIAVNMATFIGYRRRGFLGALVATVAIVLPAFIIILLIATVFDDLTAYPVVQNVFRGIRPAVAAATCTDLT